MATLPRSRPTIKDGLVAALRRARWPARDVAGAERGGPQHHASPTRLIKQIARATRAAAVPDAIAQSAEPG
jgi:hypothetical protein